MVRRTSFIGAFQRGRDAFATQICYWVIRSDQPLIAPITRLLSEIAAWLPRETKIVKTPRNAVCKVSSRSIWVLSRCQQV